MSIGYNPKIITDGLVLALDAANVKSYPGSGTTWYDLSGNNRNGTVNGAPTYTANSFTLNGNGDFFDCGSNTITGSSAFTLMSWFKTSTVSKYSGVISIGGSGNGPYIGTVAAAQVGTANSIGGGFYGNNWGTGITTVNAWVHLAMTYAGGTNGLTTFYVNGISILNQNFSGTPNTPANLIRVGRIGTDTIYDLNGSVASASIYDRQLSNAEILQNFNALKGRYGI